MTTPSFILLFLALVCSIFGTALEHTFDQQNATESSVMISMLRKHMVDNDSQNTNMNRWTKTNSYIVEEENSDSKTSNSKIKSKIIYDEIYTANEKQDKRFKLNRPSNRVLQQSMIVGDDDLNLSNRHKMRYFAPLPSYSRHKRIRRQNVEESCDGFEFVKKEQSLITHPTNKTNPQGLYPKESDCVTIITGDEGTIVQITFVDMFHIEDHPDCAYDYLEIRDGKFGYAKLLGKFCGEAFPNQVQSTGPHLWLKFHSDETIEYEGFHININHVQSASSHSIPETCFKELKGTHGIVATANIDPNCLTQSSSQALDVLWIINTPENTKIHLNFTTYQLAKPNECEDNFVEVFGSVLEAPSRLAHYCGSMANLVTTKDDAEDKGNIMYVRLYATMAAKSSAFNATFTAFRTLDPNKDEKCNEADEFDCEDNTCIALSLRCDFYPHCRLKTDEDGDLCMKQEETKIKQPHIIVILVIFSLILSGMSFVFLFKCIRKLYQDHKIIKEHIRQSCEDRLDSLVASRLTLDAKRLERDSTPRASLERENHTNEMFKRQRNYSQQKPTSIDSDFIQETQLDLDEESWRRDVDKAPIETEEVRIERNGRSRKSDLSHKEESLKKERRAIKEKSEEYRKENRDVSVGAPDTKESGCQTRESLFQTEVSSPEGTESGSGSRGFSTFGYSGATIIRTSPPAPVTATSEITIELLKGIPSRQESQIKKFPDRRPMSTETTRSAPDVIIVSKPVR